MTINFTKFAVLRNAPRGNEEMMEKNKDFRDWMLENEDNPELDLALRTLLDASSDNDPELAKAGFSEFKARTGLKKTPFSARFGNFALRFAAALLLPVLLFSIWAVSRTPSDTNMIQVCTSIAETRHIVLPDGTDVRLSPCSQLIYPEKFLGAQRKVHLAGEAFLNVTKDKKRQFVVCTGDMDVVVHGTKFNVSSFLEEVEDEVALVEGSVEMRFHDDSGPVFLAPGELVKYDRSTKNTERSLFSANYFEEVIKAGGLQFRNEKLSEIAASLNRHFNVNIIIKDSSLAEERFYASFINGENADEILSALNAGQLFNIENTEDNIFITK